MVIEDFKSILFSMHMIRANGGMSCKESAIFFASLAGTYPSYLTKSQNLPT
jgi:hypothetical protein